MNSENTMKTLIQKIIKKKKKSIIFSMFILGIVSISSPSRADDLADTFLDPVLGYLTEQANLIVESVFQDLNVVLSEVSPELAEVVNNALQSSIGELGLLDPKKLKEQVIENWSKEEEVGFGATAASKEIIRNQNHAVISSILSKDGQKQSKNKITASADSIEQAKQKSQSISTASVQVATGASTTSNLAQQINTTNEQAQTTNVSQDVIKALAQMQSYIGEQNQELAKQNQELAKQNEEESLQNVEITELLASINNQLTEGANREALNLATMTEISENLDAQVTAQKNEETRVSFGHMKTLLEASVLLR